MGSEMCIRDRLSTLERGPDPVVYANLGAVYTRLARRAYHQAHELGTGDDADSEQGTHSALALSETSNGSSETGPRDAVTEVEAFPVASRDAETQPRAPESPDAATRRQESAMALQSAAAEPAGESGDATEESRDPGTASMSPVFCAHAGGFQGRRAVADAAIWLQSYGAEVLEVRQQEHRTAGSYRVYLPPFAGREEAEAKVREIRGRGVRDVAVIPGGDLANGISFGVYTKADNMHRRVDELDKLGYSVRSRAAGEEVTEEYVIEARASGTSDALGAAWTARFPEQSIRVVGCG